METRTNSKAISGISHAISAYVPERNADKLRQLLHIWSLRSPHPYFFNIGNSKAVYREHSDGPIHTSVLVSSIYRGKGKFDGKGEFTAEPLISRDEHGTFDMYFALKGDKVDSAPTNTSVSIGIGLSTKRLKFRKNLEQLADETAGPFGMWPKAMAEITQLHREGSIIDHPIYLCFNGVDCTLRERVVRSVATAFYRDVLRVFDKNEGMLIYRYADKSLVPIIDVATRSEIVPFC